MLVGGSGQDELMGGAGDDTLFGGTGGDVFAFDEGFGQDVIRDFGPGDRINLAPEFLRGFLFAGGHLPQFHRSIVRAGREYFPGLNEHRGDDGFLVSLPRLD